MPDPPISGHWRRVVSLILANPAALDMLCADLLLMLPSQLDKPVFGLPRFGLHYL